VLALSWHGLQQLHGRFRLGNLVSAVVLGALARLALDCSQEMPSAS
jgi:hypothetical protein